MPTSRTDFTRTNRIFTPISITHEQFSNLSSNDLVLGQVYFVVDTGSVYVVESYPGVGILYTAEVTCAFEVVEDFAHLPTTDHDVTRGRLYITADTGKMYRPYFAGSYPSYEEVSPIPYLGDGNYYDSTNFPDGVDINPTPESASAIAVVTEKQVSKFVANQIALLSAGIGSVHHAPVADLAALAGLASDEQTDKEIILVEADNAIWRWDAQATTDPSAQAATVKTVVLPTDLAEDYAEDPTTPGRWIKLLNGASLTMSDATPAQIGFEDPNNDNVYTAKAATAGVSTSVARADHVHELVGVARIDQISWMTVVPPEEEP